MKRTRTGLDLARIELELRDAHGTLAVVLLGLVNFVL